MTPMAAFAKLMILLAAQSHRKWSTDTVKHLLQLNLLGERLHTSRMDSRVNSVLLAGQCLSTHDGSATLLNHPTAGPVLTTNTGETLWSALPNPPQSALPGRLIMQHDGNLVLYGRDNAPLWSTQTSNPNGAPSQLQLDGSAANQTLALNGSASRDIDSGPRATTAISDSINLRLNRCAGGDSRREWSTSDCPQQSLHG